MYKLLNRVVDTLHVRICRNRLPSSEYLQLRAEALHHFDGWEPGDDPYMIGLAGVGTFEVRPESRHYELKFINPKICDVRVWRSVAWSDSFQTGQIYVDFRSEFLQFHGLAGARKVLDLLTGFFFGEQVCDPEARLGQHDWYRISRVDLAVDTQELRGMNDSDLEQYVTRARIVEGFSTLTDATVKELVSNVLAQENPGSPSMGNKGGDNLSGPWQRPPAGYCERVALAAVREFAQSVNDARRHDKGGAFVTRQVRRSRALQTVYFGRFASDLYAIRYNKLAAAVAQEKMYMTDVWAANGWDGDSPVWRTEFRITGRMLKRLEAAVTYISDKRGSAVKIESLSDLDQFEDHMLLVWEYLTCEWLQHCDLPWDYDPNKKAQTDRWTVSAWWRIVQRAWGESAGVVTLRRKHWQPVDLLDNEQDEQLMAQLHGLTVALAARRSLDDLGSPLGVDPATGEVVGGWRSVEQDVSSFLASPDFWQRLREKRLQIGMDDETARMLSGVLAAGSLDAWESALYRRERMAEGRGS